MTGPRPKDWRKVKFFAKLTMSAIFLWWIIFRVDWREVGKILAEVRPHQLIGYWLLYFGAMLISSWKWQILARTKGIELPFGNFFRHYFTATFINNFLPSFVGGDAFKAYQAGKESGRGKEAISSVIFDRITGMWGAMILALIFGLIGWENILADQRLLLVYLGIVGALIVGFLLVKKQIFFQFLPGKAAVFFHKLVGEAASYTQTPGILTKSLFLSFIFNFVGIVAANLLLFRSLGASIGLFDFLSVIFIISIISSVPITINNIGIKEWAYVVFFGIFGVAPELAIAVAMLSRILQMVASFLALPAYLKLKKRSVQREEM